jgi:hypothetical protein
MWVLSITYPYILTFETQGTIDWVLIWHNDFITLCYLDEKFEVIVYMDKKGHSDSHDG